MELSLCIAQVSSLPLPSAAKHVLIILLARQVEGVDTWPGSEALCLDTSTPSKLVDISVNNLRQRGLIKIRREGTEYKFKVVVNALRRAVED